MKRTSISDFHCSLSQALERMGDWWTPLILRDIHLGVNRFDEIIENLGMSRNLLSARLKQLQANGMVIKREPNVGRASYQLTEAGTELMPILCALTAWGDKWTPDENGPPIQFVHERCGQISTPHIVCSCCGELFSPGSIKAIPGPGGQMAPGTSVLARKLMQSTG